MRVDTFVFVCLMIEIVIYAAVTICKSMYLLAVLSAYRALLIIAVAIRINLFDRLYAKKDSPHVASHSRMVILGLFNYLELILCFAAIYAIDTKSIKGATDWFDPFYLSAITQFTIGYGDLSPCGWLRAVAVVQGLFSLLLLVIVIGRFISILKAEISDDLPPPELPANGP